MMLDVYKEMADKYSKEITTLDTLISKYSKSHHIQDSFTHRKLRQLYEMKQDCLESYKAIIGIIERIDNAT